jgi:hypothetical protein
MAFPSIRGTPTYGDTGGNVTTFEVTLPSDVQAGDVIAIAVATDGDQTGNPALTIPSDHSGWRKWYAFGHVWYDAYDTAIGSPVATTDGSATGQVFYKIADGSEGGTTVTVNLSASEAAAWTATVLQNVDTSGYGSSPYGPPLTSANSGGGTGNPDPPSLTSGFGAVDTLWMAVGDWDGNRALTSYAQYYTLGQAQARVAASTGCGVVSAYRQVQTATEDPGNYTLAAADGWIGFTLAFKYGVATKNAALTLLDAGRAQYAPEVRPDQFVAAPLLDAARSQYAPTVVPDQPIVLAFLDSGPAQYAPTAKPINGLTLGLLDASPTVYAPSVLAEQSVTLALLDAAPAQYAPTLVKMGGTQDATLTFLDAGAAQYAPSVLADQAVTMSLLDAGPTVYVPEVIPGPLGITATLLDTGRAVYAPTVTPGPVSVGLTTLDASRAQYAPTLTTEANVFLTLIDGQPTVFAPTVTPELAAALTLLDSSPDLYPPTASQLGGPQTATATLLDAARALYPPSLLALASEIIPLLDAGRAMYAPTLELGPTPVGLAFLDAARAQYLPALRVAGRPRGSSLPRTHAGGARSRGSTAARDHA